MAPTHVALLRAINVGGKNKLPMAELKKVMSSLGFEDVATYIQSGQVVFTAPKKTDPAMADQIELAIETAVGFRPPVVVRTVDEWAALLKSDPWHDDPEPKFVHLSVHREPIDKAVKERVDAWIADNKGDEEIVFGENYFWLHTPGGLLAGKLSGKLPTLLGKTNPGTMRNRATVVKLAEMLRSS